METVEILAGGGFRNAVEHLNLTSAQCTYHYNPPPTSYREDYQVWLLSGDDLTNLCSVSIDEWQVDWGWWRYAVGSNMGVVDSDYIINGEKIRAWDGNDRLVYDPMGCRACPDYKNNICGASTQEQAACFGDKNYDDLLDYCVDEIGASTEKNICVLATDLAKQDGLTLSELFHKYLGGNINAEN